MSTLSKTRQSRNNWSAKAIVHGAGLRDAKKAEKRHEAKIERLEEALFNSESEKASLKKELEKVMAAINAQQQPCVEIRVICVLLVIDAVVFFRSISRILNSFKK